MPTSTAETSAPIISTTDLQGYYPLHENKQDQSGNNTPSNSAGISFVEKASTLTVADFTRPGAFLSPQILPIPYSSDFSLAGWMYVDSYDSVDGSQYDRGTAFGWISLKRPSGKLSFMFGWETGAEFLESTGPIEIGAWVHVSVTYARSENLIRLYINGELNNTKSPEIFNRYTPPSTPPPAASPAVAPIGGGNYEPSQQYSTLNGYLCEIYLYTRQITDQEVSTLANQNWGQDGATNSWKGDEHVPNTGMSDSPAAVKFNDQVYCFHQGHSNNGQLWFNIYDGTQWLGDTNVSGISVFGSPAVAVFDGKIYCFYQASETDYKLNYIIYDGSSWSSPAIVPNTLSSGAGLVVYNNLLYCFHQGHSNNGSLWFNVFDGSAWAGDVHVANTGISSSPSPIVFDNKIYCFHQGHSNNGSLWFNVFDGSTWAGDVHVSNTGMSSRPSAMVYENNIYCFHEGHSDNHQLWFNVMENGSWLGDEMVPRTGVSNGPSALLFNDEIYCLHQGHSDDGSLWMNIYGS